MNQDNAASAKERLELLQVVLGALREPAELVLVNHCKYVGNTLLTLAPGFSLSFLWEGNVSHLTCEDFSLNNYLPNWGKSN